MDLREFAERLWSGQIDPQQQHPWRATGELIELEPSIAFVSSFANVSAFETDDGLVLVDSGSPYGARDVHAAIRTWSEAPAHTVIFSHGHVDHVFGVGAFEEELRGEVRVVAHSGVPGRFDRYRRTAGWNGVINRRQFGLDDLAWPTEYRYPDLTYESEHVLEIGGERFELYHARGETDDHTWVWVPQRRTLCCGDLFTWAFPNVGNPQKVQRYPLEWAAALRRMAGHDAERLLPGHGPPVLGADRIRLALTETADALELLVDETLHLMNDGARLDEIVRLVRLPERLAARPYLQPVYDDPEFAVRSIWRLYGGWWDGNPASLKPAPEDEVAQELCALAGGPAVVARRAEELADAGELRMAGHLAELARRVSADPEIVAVYRRVNAARRDAEPSTMAKGIFGSAALE